MASLSDIYKQEAKSGKGLSSALGKKALEKMDPRRMFDQSGLLVAMFPALKAYSAMKPKRERKDKSDIDSTSSFSRIEATTGLTAKNTMVLPAMARDMNLMRQNIQKLVKAAGEKPSVKSDMFFKRAGERETAYESALKKMGGGLISKTPSSAGKRDGQTKDSALYVTGKGEDAESSNILAFLKDPKKLGHIAGMALRFMGPLAVGATAAYGAYNIMRDYRAGRKKHEEAGETMGSKQREAISDLPGNKLSKGNADALIDTLIREKMFDDSSANSHIKQSFPGYNLNDVLNSASPDKRKLYEQLRDNSKKNSKAETSTPEQQNQEFVGPPVPTPTPAPTSEIPSNVIKTGEALPVQTGTGGYVVSGETVPATMPAPTPAPVSPATATMPAPTPAPVSPATATMPAPTPVPVAPATSTPSVVRQGGKSSGAAASGSFNSKDSRTNIENYLGRKMSDDEYDALLKATGAEASADPKERAAVAAVILNRAKMKGSIIDVLNEPYQFHAITGPKGKNGDVNNPWSENARKKINGIENDIAKNINSFPSNLLRFTSSIRDAYKGTSSGQYERKMKEMEDAGGITIGKQIFAEGGYKTKVSSSFKLPSSGSSLTSASTAVEDGKMAAMKPVASTTTIAPNTPQKRSNPSGIPNSQTASAYDTDLIQSMVGMQYGAA
jgi:hypothetical protein